MIFSFLYLAQFNLVLSFGAQDSFKGIYERNDDLLTVCVVMPTMLAFPPNNSWTQSDMEDDSYTKTQECPQHLRVQHLFFLLKKYSKEVSYS